MTEITVINNSSRTSDNCPAETIYYQKNAPANHALSDNEFNEKVQKHGEKVAKAMIDSLQRMGVKS